MPLTTSGPDTVAASLPLHYAFSFTRLLRAHHCARAPMVTFMPFSGIPLGLLAHFPPATVHCLRLVAFTRCYTTLVFYCQAVSSLLSAFTWNASFTQYHTKPSAWILLWCCLIAASSWVWVGYAFEGCILRAHFAAFWDFSFCISGQFSCISAFLFTNRDCLLTALPGGCISVLFFSSGSLSFSFCLF